jgi:hypothetical protein
MADSDAVPGALGELGLGFLGVWSGEGGRECGWEENEGGAELCSGGARSEGAGAAMVADHRAHSALGMLKHGGRMALAT